MALLNILFPDKIAIAGAILFVFGSAFIIVSAIRAHQRDPEGDPLGRNLKRIGYAEAVIGLFVYVLSLVFG